MSNLGNFVWGIADQLRGVYRPSQYGNVILPMTILRRLDCILDATRDDVRALAGAETRPEILDVRVRKQTGLTFYNTSDYDLARLKKDPATSAIPVIALTALAMKADEERSRAAGCDA